MSGFDLLAFLVPRAKRSSLWLWILNKVLSWTVPFNWPHGFKLYSIGDTSVQTTAAYRRFNQNHIRGIHACAIATTAEFSSGFLLLMHLDPSVFRLIMSRIEVDYHYQAKERIISTSAVTSDDLSDTIHVPLEDEDSVTISLESVVKDNSGNEVATARTTWQIKRWDRVRTRM